MSVATRKALQEHGNDARIGVHAQRVLEVRPLQLVQGVRRRQAALGRNDERLHARVRAQPVRHQLVMRAVQTAEHGLDQLPFLRRIITRLLTAGAYH